MAQERAEQVGPALQGAGVEAGEGIHFQVAPSVLEGIEFRGVRREKGGERVGMSDQELGGPARPMGIEVVPEHHPGAVQFALQTGAKADHVTRWDVGIRVEAKVKVHALTAGSYAQGGHHGDFAVVGTALDPYGSVAAGSPTAAHPGSHEQAAFVQKHPSGVQSSGFF